LSASGDSPAVTQDAISAYLRRGGDRTTEAPGVRAEPVDLLVLTPSAMPVIRGEVHGLQAAGSYALTCTEVVSSLGLARIRT